MCDITQYIRTLVDIPSPTGFTADIGSFLMKNAKEKGISATRTRKGAVIYRFNKDQSKETVMFAAHIDTLGAMIKEVKEDTVLFTSIGTYPPAYIIGNYCTIHTYGGEKISGTILPVNPAFHVNNTLHKDYKPDLSHLSIRIDIRKENGNQSPQGVIEPGNFVSFAPEFSLSNGFVKSRHLDDKASCAVLLSVADLIQTGKIELKKEVHLFFNITEETGQGLAGFPEHADDLIIVDMGVVGEGCSGDEYSVSICAKDSSGPYNYELTQQLIRLAKEKNIDHRVDVFPFYGSDGSAILRSCRDMRVALLGPGISASHGHERTHSDALQNTLALVKAFISE